MASEHTSPAYDTEIINSKSIHISDEENAYKDTKMVSCLYTDTAILQHFLERLVSFHVAAKGWISVQCIHKINAIHNKTNS